MSILNLRTIVVEEYRRQCMWRIFWTENHGIVIVSSDIYLPESDNCEEDLVVLGWG